MRQVNSKLEARPPLPTFRQREPLSRPFINPQAKSNLSREFKNGRKTRDRGSYSFSPSFHRFSFLFALVIFFHSPFFFFFLFVISSFFYSVYVVEFVTRVLFSRNGGSTNHHARNKRSIFMRIWFRHLFGRSICRDRYIQSQFIALGFRGHADHLAGTGYPGHIFVL